MLSKANATLPNNLHLERTTLGFFSIVARAWITIIVPITGVPITYQNFPWINRVPITSWIK
jgi:biotin transporter BioY